jgi:hypothetical protein
LDGTPAETDCSDDELLSKMLDELSIILLSHEESVMLSKGTNSFVSLLESKNNVTLGRLRKSKSVLRVLSV